MPKGSVMARQGWLAALALLAACGPSAAAQAQNRETVPADRTVLTPGAAPGDTISAARLSGAFRAAADRALPAVVAISVTSTRSPAVRRVPPRVFPFYPDQELQVPEAVPQQGSGSGFIFDARGYIMTNRHVVRNATQVVVNLVDGREYSATVVGEDANTDVAVVKIEPGSGEQLPVARFGDSDHLQVGDWVLALGNPLDLGFTVTAGIVSAKGRALGILRQENDFALEAFIQTDAAINPGNSGGPLVDLQGRVVGVNTAIASRTGFYSGYGFAIPTALARRVARDLVEYGAVRRPRLGVQVGPVTSADAEVYGLSEISGAHVTMVQPGTAASKAGLRLGDVIVALDGKPIRDNTELTAQLAQRRPGERVRLTVVRDRKRDDIHVELGEFETAVARKAEGDPRPATEDLLGFQAASLTAQQAARLGVRGEGGVVITRLTPLSPAAGRLVPGETIVSINGKTVQSVRDLERIAGEIEAGDAVSVVVRDAEGNERIANYRTRR